MDVNLPIREVTEAEDDGIANMRKHGDSLEVNFFYPLPRHGDRIDRLQAVW
jgi:hypothetical protein